MDFKELDDVREFMLEELDWSIEKDKVYYSAVFVPGVENDYLSLLRQAISEHDEEWLEQRLTEEYFKNTQERKTKKGVTQANVNKQDAAKRLAQNEFNKFYIRGVCRKALNHSNENVKIYRAKESSVKREESQKQIGEYVNANNLLENLRNEVEIDLPKIYSGLSVQTIEE